MNTQVDVAEIVNRIFAYAVPGRLSPERRTFPRIAEGISIPPDVVQEYYAAVREFHKADKKIAAKYSTRAFENEVIKFIAPFVLKSKNPDKMSISAFQHELLSRAIETHDVYRPIHRITKSRASGPVVLGAFILYNSVFDADALDSALRGVREDTLLNDSEHYLIRCTVIAHDFDNALELADARFEQFENAIRFMVGPESYYDATVFGSSRSNSRTSIVRSKTNWSSAIGSNFIPKDLDIDDPYFMYEVPRFDRVWEHLGRESNSPLMKKILLAVDWVGQSIAEKVPSSAFLKAAIALEVLFTPEKGQFAPSIVFQITENVTLLLGKDRESRINGEKEFKHLYEIRSGIAHAGRTEIAQEDLTSIQEMARQVIFKLLTSPAVKDCTTSEQLGVVLKALKYNCPALD